MIVILHHSGNRYVKSQLFEHFQGGMHLPLSAVHKDYVRKPGKSRISVFRPLKSPGQDLLHTCIIIRSFDPLDPEFSVVAPPRSSLFIDDHRTDRIIPADI